jgi:hypothetical protein
VILGPPPESSKSTRWAAACPPAGPPGQPLGAEAPPSLAAGGGPRRRRGGRREEGGRSPGAPGREAGAGAACQGAGADGLGLGGLAQGLPQAPGSVGVGLEGWRRVPPQVLARESLKAQGPARGAGRAEPSRPGGVGACRAFGLPDPDQGHGGRCAQAGGSRVGGGLEGDLHQGGSEALEDGSTRLGQGQRLPW